MRTSSRHRILILVAASVSAVLALAGRAAASPQLLGIVASNGHPTPLLCDATGECHARFSAFCLQQARPAPSQGTPYRLADAGALTLLVTHKDGRVERLPGAAFVRFESGFGFTSVEAVLPAAVRRTLDASALEIEIGPAATLLPIEAVGDPDPQSAEEIAAATGPMRMAAARLFDTPGPSTDAARLINAAVNALPPAYEDVTAPLDGMWAQTLAAGKAQGASAAGLAAADGIWQSCKLALASQTRQWMRQCLEMRHTELMVDTNHEFWEETGGS